MATQSQFKLKSNRQRSTNNSKSCELFNEMANSPEDQFSDLNRQDLLFNNSPNDLIDKKTRNEQLKLDKKRLAFEKRLLKQREKEAKRLKKETLRKYREELKTEIREAKLKQFKPTPSNSNSSLAKDLEQFVTNDHFNKSNLKQCYSNQFDRKSYLNQQFNEYQNGFYYNQNPIYENQYNLYSDGCVSNRLEPFRVNMNSNHEFSYLNTGNSNGYDVEHYSVEKQLEPIYIEINKEESFNAINFINYPEPLKNDLTYENLNDINLNDLDTDLTLDFIKQDIQFY